MKVIYVTGSHRNRTPVPITFTDNDEAVCPVCGVIVAGIGDGHVWAEMNPDGSWRLYPSHDICDECGVEYGAGDVGPAEMTQHEVWDRLRILYLQRCSSKAAAIQRIQANLGVEAIIDCW